MLLLRINYFYPKKLIWICFIAITVLSFTPKASFSDQMAFPGAIGYGQNSIGWRGGDIVAITNLEDNGAGSLRECAQAIKTPRVCIFKVSGTIFLDSPIRISSNLYLAGQTAPGNGIQLRLRSGDLTPIVIKNVEDVLIRYLKIRPGAGTKRSANIDAITVESSRNIYLDALSMQFASDETFNIHVNKTPAQNITLARSILSHSLDRSVHPKGRHSKGALICSNEGAIENSYSCGAITVADNFFAHNRDRNPDVKGTEIGPIEIINNIFYNPISQFGEFYDLLGNATIYYVGNITKTGPSSKRFPALAAVEGFEWDDKRTLKIYEDDNLNYNKKNCNLTPSGTILNTVAERVRINEPVTPLTFTPKKSADVEKTLLQNVGANLPKWGGLDVLDLRAVKDYNNCTGRVIDTPDQAGGWPDLEIVFEDDDQDNDGLPDSWEASKDGLDATTPRQAWKDRDNDGWSNIEEYLSWLAGDKTLK